MMWLVDASNDVSGPTPRQLEIIALCARGYTRQQIAAELFISPFTVRNHYADIRERLGGAAHVGNMAQALAICVARGYLCVDARTERVYIPVPLETIAA